MPTIADWYSRVNAAWPADVPTLTAPEAERAARRLYRFAMKRTWRGAVRLTSGNRYTWVRGSALVVNPEKGWHELVHALSHYAFFRLRGERPHSKAHARFELRMVKEVVRRGWLTGAIARAPKPVPDRAAVLNADYVKLLASIKRWETRLKRAETILKKRRALARRWEKKGATA